MGNGRKKHSLAGKAVKFVLILLIAAYPLAGAFFGLDLGDTGYHLYAYTHFFSRPDKINYTTFLTTAAAWGWGRLFDSYGLIAYNLLEVLLEWCLSLMTYCMTRKVLGEITSLTGILLAVISADCYLNIFNYHQLNVFLMVLIMYLQILAVTRDKKTLSVLAGIVYALVVFSRVGSVIAAGTCFIYIYWGIMRRQKARKVSAHLVSFCLGAAAAGGAALALLMHYGRLEMFIGNIFRLRDVASDTSGSYAIHTLVRSLFGQSLKAVTSGLMFYGAAAIILTALNIMACRCEGFWQKALYVFFALLCLCVALYQMKYAYTVNPAENWPQHTTGPRFLIGVLYVSGFISLAGHACRKDEKSFEITLLSLAAFMLVFLTIAGTNTGTKHVILATWILFPLSVYVWQKLIRSPGAGKAASFLLQNAGLELAPHSRAAAAAIVLAVFFIHFGSLVYHTFNYDALDRRRLTETVANDRVRWIRTTREEKEALEGVLSVLENYDQDQPLSVFGNSLLFYYMTGREAYGMPWITQFSYPVESLAEDFGKAEKEYADTCPLIVFCRTNYAYGFDESTAGILHQEVWHAGYNGKKEYIASFMEDKDYGLVYLDDYYAVFEPGSREDGDVRRIMYGN